MSKPVNFYNVEKFLNGLGNSPDEVAQTLKKRGIKGIAVKANSCPVAIALKRRWPKRDISVVSTRIYFDRSYDYFARTPQGVERFIRMFDEGQYPELRA